jgi:hypothetical protein
MEFGQIIKKAWKITWRYRFLWVLGIFAGVTGAGGGGGGYSGGGQNFGSGSSGSSGGSPFASGDASQALSTFQQWLPAIIAAAVIWILIGLVFWILSLAAKGGLIWAVDEIEEGRPPTLGDAWNRGFSHFWRVLGLGLLLQLPVLFAVIVLAAAIGIPIAFAIARGGDGMAAAAILPVCGSLAIGIPVLLVMGFILGIMYVIALRRIVLDGEGVIQSAKDAWKTFRARFKDTALMWLINWGLNVVAGIVFAIPIIIITVLLVIPAVFAGVGQQWGVLVGVGILWFVVLIVMSFFYAAVWGTFTSALWTILYRRMTGRELVAPPAGPGSVPPPPAWPATPGYPAPGTAPGAPPADYYAPPVAGWAAPPAEAAGWSPDAAPSAPPRGPAHDPYSPPEGEPRPPLDPYTPWVPGDGPPEQPPNE